MSSFYFVKACDDSQFVLREAKEGSWDPFEGVET